MDVQEEAIESLVERCKVGDRKAQESLYRKLYKFSLLIAMRYSRDEADAADIISHAFLKIFRSINSFDSAKGIFYAWVKKIIINEGLDHIKSRKQFKVIQFENTEPSTVVNLAVNKLSAGEVMELVRQLPPATHAVFVLYVVDGYNHREIAERLNISQGTSKWHLSEARKQLQKKLSEYQL